MQVTRREWLAASAGFVGMARHAGGAEDGPVAPQLIVDTHQHLWDRRRLSPPWLERDAPILRARYDLQEYREATRGLNIRSMYMEVDAAEDQLEDESRAVVEWRRQLDSRMVGATIGGRPDSADFADYLDRHAVPTMVQGVRRVLHSSATPPGHCLRPEFISGIRELGRRGLFFDLCMRPKELGDAVTLAQACPDTRFVLDHCGNADPIAFVQTANAEAAHTADDWRRSIDRLAAQPNVICKISGVVARAPLVWTASDLAPAVNHCLDAFGSDRVLFGSDWPVCLTRSTLQQWVAALRQIIADRPLVEQAKLWSGNALRLYKLAIA